METEKAACRQGRYYMLKAYLMQLLILVMREQCEPVKPVDGFAFDEKMQEDGDERNQKADVRHCNDAIHDRQFDLIGHRQDGDEAKDIEPNGNLPCLHGRQIIVVVWRLESIAGPDPCDQVCFRMQSCQFIFIRLALGVYLFGHCGDAFYGYG